MAATIQAEWSGIRWGICDGAVRGLQTLARTRALKAVQQSDLSGSASVATRGMEPFTATISWRISSAATGDGVTDKATFVRDTIDAWEAAIGQSDHLLVGGSRWCPEPLRLTAVSSSEITLDAFGRLLAATITATFTEDVPERAAKRKSAARRPRRASPAIYEELGTASSSAAPSHEQRKAAVLGGKNR